MAKKKAKDNAIFKMVIGTVASGAKIKDRVLAYISTTPQGRSMKDLGLMIKDKAMEFVNTHMVIDIRGTGSIILNKAREN